MIGLITYHSAYNYGSALQAYATQQAIENLGHTVEIINYRMKEQKQVYSLYRTKYGLKTFIKDLLQFPVHRQRKMRCLAFESFFDTYMNLTDSFENPEEVSGFWDKYELIVSGSDQIWNKHSLEMEYNSWDYMYPYLLKDYGGKKVSYASSISNMSDEELVKIAPYIKDFSDVSIREISSVKRIDNYLQKKVTNVLDPTFLLNKAEWIDALGLKNRKKEDYILYYSLESYGTFRRNVKKLKAIADKDKTRVLVISPFVYQPMFDESMELCSMMGPKEFLNAVYNAKKVITNSYHGTILAVNFEKDVFSLCENIGSEFRKTDILNLLGLEKRIIHDLSELTGNDFEKIDYLNVQKKLDTLRQNSLDYLKEALEYKEK